MRSGGVMQEKSQCDGIKMQGCRTSIWGGGNRKGKPRAASGGRILSAMAIASADADSGESLEADADRLQTPSMPKCFSLIRFKL